MSEEKKSSKPVFIKPALFVSPEVKSLRRILIYGLLGVVAFLLVLPAMWFYVTWYEYEGIEAQHVSERVQETETDGLNEEEKLKLLQSLKSDADVPPEEEQRAVLEKLHSGSSASMTKEEKRAILENL